MYLVLIETSGNQNYIFATNKLRENIGASELTYRSGTEWVLKAVEKITHIILWDEDTKKLRENLLNPTLNKPIEGSASVPVEVLIATSGKALLLTREYKDAKQVIQEVTLKAIKEAPSLDICGVISSPFDWNAPSFKEHGLGSVNRETHKKFEIVRSQRPSPVSRFLRLPVVDECATSGLPASPEIDKRTGKNISSVSFSKQSKNEKAFTRVAKLLKNDERQIRFAKNIGELDRLFGENEDSSKSLDQESNEFDGSDDKMAWRAIIHADGNGLGEIFLKFDEQVSNNRDYVDKYRRFSLALDVCTESSFLKALNVFVGNPKSNQKISFERKIPIIPLVLGGDDLTVVCDGSYALNFTYEFLRAFEQETSKTEHYDGIIAEVAKEALKVEPGRLSACAGVAIVKLHFPFSVAYELAEGLMKSAKTVKKNVTDPNDHKKPYPCSALDFHVLYDSSNVDLGKMRDKLVIKDGDNPASRLYQRPYVATKIDQIAEASGQEWARLHQWEELIKRVQALQAKGKENDRSNLPNSQIHELRSDLFLGKQGADARYQLIRDRYVKQDENGKEIQDKSKDIRALEGDDKSLFKSTAEKVDGADKQIYVTAFLDAIEAKEFLQSEEGKGNG
jgi:hypothetical protein